MTRVRPTYHHVVKLPGTENRASPIKTPGIMSPAITLRLLLFSAVLSAAAPLPFEAR